MSIPPGTLFVASDEYLRGDYGLKAWLMVGFSAAGLYQGEDFELSGEGRESVWTGVLR
jgi:hypothetical protein